MGSCNFLYNECFYEMRKSLKIEPYNFLSDYEQIAEKSKNIYLFLNEREIVGTGWLRDVPSDSETAWK